MMRIVCGVSMLGAAVYGYARDNASMGLAALIAGLTLLAWAVEQGDWTFRVHEVDGIPATKAMRRVVALLLTGADRLSGLAIGRLSGVGSAAVYVCLDRLETAGWIVGEWERPEQEDRRGQRFYRLTPRGRDHALDLLRLAERPGRAQ
ncbi:helix-turn-helix transcriptional regulator [Nonomuraea sp. NPDC050404]|uniref:PadR family transcriptional regulator n=1 Tax=Nonomuraea sp. NPDC050404 TaxID=3155783 RepID=UPI0033C904C1